MFVAYAVRDAQQGIRWGMSQSQVKRREDATLVEESDAELYYTLVGDFPLAVNYRFAQDRLVEISRVPGEQYISLESALDAIETLLGNYGEQYGALSEEIAQPYWLEFVWNTPESKISVVVWYAHEGGYWSWVATSKDASFVEPPYELADENVGRV